MNRLIVSAFGVLLLALAVWFSARCVLFMLQADSLIRSESSRIETAILHGEELRQAIFDYKYATGLWPLSVSDVPNTALLKEKSRWNYHWMGYNAPPRLAISPAMHCMVSYAFPENPLASVEATHDVWTVNSEGSIRTISTNPISWTRPERSDNAWKRIKVATLEQRLSLSQSSDEKAIQTMKALICLLSTLDELSKASDQLRIMESVTSNDSWPYLVGVDVAGRLDRNEAVNNSVTWIMGHGAPRDILCLSPLLWQYGHEEEAHDVLTRALNTSGDRPIPMRDLAEIAGALFEQGRDEDCLKVCDAWDAVANDATVPSRGYCLLRAAVFIRRGDFASAVEQRNAIATFARAGQLRLTSDDELLIRAISDHDASFRYVPSASFCLCNLRIE